MTIEPDRPLAVALGLVGLSAIGALAMVVAVPSIERHLRDDVTVHVTSAMPSVTVSVHGTEVVLRGTVESEDDLRALGDQVKSRWGVTSVDLDGVRVRSRRASVNPGSVPSPSTPLPSSPPSVGPASTTTPPSGSSTTTSIRPGTSTTSATSTSTTRPATTTTSVTTTLAPTTTVAPTTTTARPTTSTTPPTTTTTIVIDPAVASLLQDQLTAIRQATPIVFVRSSSTVSPTVADALGELAAAILATPTPVRIEAHTDASGNPQRNLVLSQQRAAAVRNALIARGVPASLLIPVGRGETAPIASNNTAAGKTANRRIEFVVVGGPNDSTRRPT